MDVVMPKMSGFDAAKEIRRRIPASKQPKIIALTAYVIPNSKQICLEAGMDDYIGKPVTIQELSNIISKNMQSVKPT
jgi:CheY-like chemotaxis protein